MNFVFLMLSVLLITKSKGNRVNYESCDLTWSEDGKGRDVVEATIQKIKTFAGVKQDYSILRRTALMESTFGEDTTLMNANPLGGIWQINPNVHNISNQFGLRLRETSSLNDRIEDTFNIECLFCSFNYSTPMVSALAAQVFFDCILGPNTPGIISSQASIWAEDYHPNGSIGNFTDVITAFRKNEDKFCDEDFKLDLWVLLDDSEDVSDEQFQSQINFTSVLAAKFNISNSQVQIGLSVLSKNEHYIRFRFNQSNSLSAFENAVHETQRKEVDLQTSEAFRYIANTAFSQEKGARATEDEDLRRFVVFITDEHISENIASGQTSQMSSTAVRSRRFISTEETNTSSITQVENANITVIVISIGSRCNQGTLEIIATDPAEENVFNFNSYSSLNNSENYEMIYKQICNIDFAYSVISHIQNALLSNPSSYEDHLQLIESIEGHFDLQQFDHADESSSDVIDTLSNIFEDNKEISNNNLKNLKRQLISWTANNYNKDCDANLKLDIWILLNGKFQSYEKNFENAANFVSKSLSKFSISPYKVQVGFSISHGNKHEIYFHFNEYSDAAQLKNYLWTAPHPDDRRETGKAMHEILQEGFTESAGSRHPSTFVPRALVIITNGRRVINLTLFISEIDKANITVYVAGFGNYVNETEMEILASQPIRKHSFHLQTLDRLELDFLPEIYTSLCRSSIPVTATFDITLVLKKDVQRFLRAKVHKDEDLRINFAAHEDGKVGKAYISVAITEPNSAYYDISIDLGKGNTKVLVKVSELLAKHKGRIQNLEKFILEDEFVPIYMTLISTGHSTMNLTATVRPLEQGRPVPYNEGDDLTTMAIIPSSTTTRTTTTSSLLKATTVTETAVLQNTNSFTKNSVLRQSAAFDETSSLQDVILEASSFSPYKDSNETKPSTDVQINISLTQANKPNTPDSKDDVAQSSSNQVEGNEKELDTTTTKDNPDFNLLSTTNVNVSVKLLPFVEEPNDGGASQQTAESGSAVAAVAVVPVILFFLILAYYRKRNKKKIDPAVKLAAMQELKNATESAKASEAKHVEMETLQSSLTVVIGLGVSEEEMEDAKQTLKALEKRLADEEERAKNVETLLKELETLTLQAQSTSATAACMFELEGKLSSAESLSVSYDKLIEAYDVLSQLRYTIEEVLADIEEITQEAMNSFLSLSCMEKLEQQLKVAEKREIPREKLKKSYEVLDKMKQSTLMLESLEMLSSEANNLAAKQSCADRLEKKLALAEKMNLPSSSLESSYEALANLKQRLKEKAEKLEKIERLKSELNSINKEASSPSATTDTMVKLEGLLNEAGKLEIPQKELKQLFNILEELKTRIHEVLDDMKSCVSEALQADATFTSMKHLEEHLKLAGKLKIPSEQCEDANCALNGLKDRLSNFKVELDECAEVTKNPTASCQTERNLREKLDEAKRLKFPKNHLEESYNALENITGRFELLKDLDELMAEAKEPTASEYNLHKLEEKLKAAKNFNLTSEQLQKPNHAFKELKDRLDQEAEKLNQSGKLLEELQKLTIEAKLPNATLPTLQKLEFMINRAQKLPIPKEGLQESVNTMEELKNRINTVSKDLKLFTEESKKPDATVDSLDKLAKQIELAENLKLPSKQLRESYDGLEEIKERISAATKELNEKTEEAKELTATVITMESLQEKLEAAERLKIPKNQMKEAQIGLQQLQNRVTQVTKDLNEAMDESNADTATVESIAKLQEKLVQAEDLKIPKDNLNGSYNSLEELKRRIEKFVNGLNKSTDDALKANATMLCAEKLQEELLQGERLQIPPEQLKASYNALQELKSREEEVIRKLMETTVDASDPNATVDLIEGLQEKLIKAEHFKISEEKLKESRNALAVLKNRVDTILKDVKTLTDETRQPDATFNSMERLEKQIELAEKFKISTEKLKESYNGLEEMRERVQKVVKELDESAHEAKTVSATMVSLQSLQEKLDAAERLQLPDSQLKESQNALEHLKSRVNMIMKDLNEATIESKDQSATFVSMESLQEKLLLAENLKIPEEKLKESYNLLEELKNRVNKFIGDLNAATYDAKDPVANLLCAEKLEEQLLKAENLKIPPENLKESYYALEQIKSRADTVMKDLVDTTTDARLPTATLLSIEKLEEKLLSAEKLGIPEERLKDSCDALEILRARVNMISKDLTEATLASTDVNATVLSMEVLEQKLLFAESLQMPHEQLKDSYDVLEKLKGKIELVRKNLSDVIGEAQISTALVPCVERLQESLLLAERMQIPSEQLKEASDSLEKLKDRINVVRQDLTAATYDSREDSATMLSMETLETKILLAQSFQIPEEEMKDSLDALETLRNRVNVVTMDVQDFTNLALTTEANFSSFSALQEKLELAASMHIPVEQLQQSYEAFQKLKKEVEEITNELRSRTAEASNIGNLRSMIKLEEQLDLAEKFSIPNVQLLESKEILDSLKNRFTEVRDLKEAFRIAIEDRDLDELEGSLERSELMVYLLEWDPEDEELKDLLKQAKVMQKQLLAEAKNSPEEIALRNKLREELKVAIKNDIARKPFHKAQTDFRQSLGSKADQADKALVAEAKAIYTVKCKSFLQDTLNTAIKKRKADQLNAALGEVNKALQAGDIRYPDIETTVPLKLAISKAKDLLNVLAELEKMKQAVMSLKQPTISEIRSYQQPPIIIRNVMEATFLLLGEDRKKVKEWIEIQAFVGKMGKDALKKRIVERDISLISKQVAERAAPLLSGLRMDEIEEISKASSVFFAWCKCVLHEVDAMHDD